MKHTLSALTFLTVLTGIILLSGCRKHKMDGMEEEMGMEKNINYPAAYVVNGESNTISVIKLSDNTVSETIDLMGTGMDGMMMWPHHIYHTVNANGHQLAIAMPGMDLSAGHAGNTAGMKGRVMILDATKGTVIKDMEVPAMNHNAVFSPNGTELWTSQMGDNGKILVLDATTYTIKNTIQVGDDPAEITFSPDGSKAYVANGGNDNISVINPATKAIIATIPVGDNPVAAWIGYDGNMYVDNEDGQSVSIISIANNSVVATIPLGFMPGSVAHNSIKKELWVTDPENSKVHYWNWDEGQKTWLHGGVITTGAGAHATVFTNDGNTAYVSNQMAQSVSVINVANHFKMKDIPVGKKPNGIVIKY